VLSNIKTPNKNLYRTTQNVSRFLQRHAKSLANFAPLGKVGVSWIGMIRFWWLGASGLGQELVAKPVLFSCAQAVEVGGQFGASTFQ
jgi:hypothetical protein